MFKKDDKIYTVVGDLNEDLRILTLNVVHSEDMQIWVKDTEGDSFLIDLENIIPKYADALRHLATLADLKMKDLKEELAEVKEVKKSVKEILKGLRK